MAKTLVVPKHEPGPAINGHDGCHARVATDGICPGVSTADWLNSLGDDDEVYITVQDRRVTNGMVRDNWLRDNSHIVAKEPALADLRARERRLAAELRIVKRDIKRLEAA